MKGVDWKITLGSFLNYFPLGVGGSAVERRTAPELRNELECYFVRRYGGGGGVGQTWNEFKMIKKLEVTRNFMADMEH